MKITETGDYLRIALQTLEAKIAPEMTTPDGHAAAAILGRVLNELARRETVSAPALAANLATGRDILDKLTNFADTHLPAAVPSADTGRSDESQFSPLAGEHERLSQRLCSLAAALADARPGLDGDQQGALSALLLDMARWDEAFVSAQRTLPLPPAPKAPAHRGTPLTQDLLEAFLRTVHPDGSKVTVTQFKPIPGGFGKQTSRLRYTDAAGIEHDAIVRKSDPVPMTAMGAFSIANEFALLRAVHGAGILPLAEPLWLARDFPGVDADFYIMSALPGAVPSSFLGAASARIPENIILEMAEKMARLHQLDLDELAHYLSAHDNPAVLNETVEQCYRRLIAQWKDYYAAGDHLPAPFVIYLLDWLGQNVPANPARPVLVHGDFNVHNILVDDGRITGILDWECANMGAPEQDLAYVRPIISQHIEWDRFIDHYEASGGPVINRAAMDFYMAFAAMRLCVIFNKGVKNLQQGAVSDIRYGIIDLDLTPEFMAQALACTTGR